MTTATAVRPRIHAADPRHTGRIDFEDDADFDFLDQIQENAALRMLRADRHQREATVPLDAFFD